MTPASTMTPGANDAGDYAQGVARIELACNPWQETGNIARRTREQAGPGMTANGKSTTRVHHLSSLHCAAWQSHLSSHHQIQFAAQLEPGSWHHRITVYTATHSPRDGDEFRECNITYPLGGAAGDQLKRCLKTVIQPRIRLIRGDKTSGRQCHQRTRLSLHIDGTASLCTQLCGASKHMSRVPLHVFFLSNPPAHGTGASSCSTGNYNVSGAVHPKQCIEDASMTRSLLQYSWLPCTYRQQALLYPSSSPTSTHAGSPGAQKQTVMGEHMRPLFHL